MVWPEFAVVFITALLIIAKTATWSYGFSEQMPR